MSDREYIITMDLDEAFGLRELRAKINGRIGATNKLLGNRFCINAELCYGPESVEITRKYLDAGALQNHLGKVRKTWNTSNNIPSDTLC